MRPLEPLISVLGPADARGEAAVTTDGERLQQKVITNRQYSFGYLAVLDSVVCVRFGRGEVGRGQLPAMQGG